MKNKGINAKVPRNDEDCPVAKPYYIRKFYSPTMIRILSEDPDYFMRPALFYRTR
jgi:hypothetical protein